MHSLSNKGETKLSRFIWNERKKKKNNLIVLTEKKKKTIIILYSKTEVHRRNRYNRNLHVESKKKK